MSTKNSIDKQKTEDTGSDSVKYGDSNDMGLTHYLGNDENKPREKNKDPEDENNIGKVAQGNVDE